MKETLEALGFDPDAEALYRRILRHTPTDLGAHATRLNWTRTRALAALAVLSDRQLVRTSEDGTVRADHPGLALEKLIEREERSLELRRRQLSAGRTLIPSFLADQRVGLRSPKEEHPAWESVSSESAPMVVENLLRNTTGELRQVNLTVSAGPASEADFQDMALNMLGNVRRSSRAIYPSHALQDPAWQAYMAAFASVGEAQRCHAEVTTEFVVFGESAVVALEQWGQADGDVVIIRDQMLVRTFAALFDTMWETALPLPSGPVVDDGPLIECLGLGMKDESIARHLGLSLRTVRRRIATLMDSLGVDTRFQLGVEVERRSLR